MPGRFDVFLSHATADKPQVEELARQLRRKKIPDRHGFWGREGGVVT